MTDPKTLPPLRVAMIGYSFMGAAHSQAWRTAPRFFDLPLDVVMDTVVGRNAEAVTAAASKLGWARAETDWRRVIERDDIDLIDICAPGRAHAEIAIAALDAGKHVLCEKPLARTVPEAEAMADAARRARPRGVRAMVGFTYRRVPAVALMRRLVEQGRIGEVRHVRGVYLQDWLTDPDAPLTWRLERDEAGSGSLGDLGAHVIDMAQYVTGERLVEISGMTKTFVTERPYRASTVGLSGAADLSRRGPVTVDDATAFIGRLSGGGMAVIEATRFAAGHKNGLRLEVNGVNGSLVFELEDMNRLSYMDAREGSDTAGFRSILTTEADHPYVAGWWPPGHSLGYEHGFTHQVLDLVRAIAAGEDPAPSFDDGLQVQRVLEAVDASAESRTWQAIPG
jgi:predicted dehydrogenase